MKHTIICIIACLLISSCCHAQALPPHEPGNKPKVQTLLNGYERALATHESELKQYESRYTDDKAHYHGGGITNGQRWQRLRNDKKNVDGTRNIIVYEKKRVEACKQWLYQY